MKDIEKSTAPLFITYSAKPTDADPKSHLLTKADLATHLDPANFAPGFENGQIVCALVPIDYKYVEEGSDKPVFGKVSLDALTATMQLKSDIAHGRASKPTEPVKPKVPSNLPNYISLSQVKEVLIAKGYDSKGTQGWDADNLTYLVADPGNVLPQSSDGFYPIHPVNNPVWGKEELYEPKFCTAQVLSLPDCELTSHIPLP